jgi:hypothetical protein
MKERSDTVRVFTHPETWRSQRFRKAGLGVSTPQCGAIRWPDPLGSSSFHTSLCRKSNASFRSVPRTCTVGRDSEYSISFDVIQRVICKWISRVVAHPPACEVA